MIKGLLLNKVQYAYIVRPIVIPSWKRNFTLKKTATPDHATYHTPGIFAKSTNLHTSVAKSVMYHGTNIKWIWETGIYECVFLIMIFSDFTFI